MSVTTYIKQLQRYEEYAFSWEELLKNCDVSTSTLRKELRRLSEKKEIINLRKGFFLIVPPRYQNLGKLPVQLYVDKLFQQLGKKYYVGLYSAAAIHGAAHQQVQQDYIVTVSPALSHVDKTNIRLRFFSVKYWPGKNIQEKKSDAGYFKVSSPALTAADLVHHHSKIGGMNRILTAIEELAEEIHSKDVTDLLSWYPHISALQRLGYLLDQIQVGNDLTDPIYEYLNKGNYYSILLSPKGGQKAGSTGNRWKVDVNIKLESDLI